ncbi:hypothetical protein QBZ16_004417 [Prototheca wickerhamii]|uniref:Peroxisomal ATPase PEX1 n=1 Tax=Prototheca wickerhamii TaxID=3111 RepID=A0AAD9IJY9_PROWI|nr:hypothetical protein QBZ16_004417 [Prototheca wickerhamii]
MFSGQGGEGRGCAVSITRDRHNWGKDAVAVAWGGEASEAGKVGVPSGLALALGLHAGDKVDVVPAPSSSLPVAESISVEPANADDWEVVELNAGYLEEHALSQVAIVSVQQPLPFWIHGQLAMLKVVASVPADAPVLRLQAGSEMFVAPRLRSLGTPVRPAAGRETGPCPWSEEFELAVDDAVPLGHIRLSTSDGDRRGLSQFSHARVSLSAAARAENGGAGSPQDAAAASSDTAVMASAFATPDTEPTISASQADTPAPADPQSWLRPTATKVLSLPGADGRGRPRSGGAVLTAQRGAGAAELVDFVAARLAASPATLTHTVRVACGSPDALRLLRRGVAEALARCPSLLAAAQQAPGAPAAAAEVADLLDALARPSPEEWGLAAGSSDADAGARPRSGRWAPIAVLATARDATALAPSLKAPGRLDTAVELPAPGVEDRAAILAGELERRGVGAGEAELRELARRAEGYDSADLATLADRALHVALRRALRARVAAGRGRGVRLAPTPSSSSLAAAEPQKKTPKQRLVTRVTLADLEEALRGLTPAAYWGAGAPAKSARTAGWEDVGGMDEVREALHESLELPIRHAGILAAAPLRLRTGVLLYGPPGCGKTHVVSCAVAAAGVRCITVRGPELLNKYIGASEAAVRDVFARATAAAPSVLFFDEFDAIAPQRGHDNTGVTDRVVNQLLTELDGVEGLRGVCVVAATSRPDLIDAALLRPGRLDRLVFCDFPTPRERGKILRALARSMPLADDVDLDLLGREADHATGADLGALLSEAQLAAAHEALERAEGAGQRAQITVGQAHLAAALAAARPSVPAKERSRFEAIYARFQEGRDGNLGEEPLSPRDKGKRQTLA